MVSQYFVLYYIVLLYAVYETYSTTSMQSCDQHRAAGFLGRGLGEWLSGYGPEKPW